jgi:hypothetical protein
VERLLSSQWRLAFDGDQHKPVVNLFQRSDSSRGHAERHTMLLAELVSIPEQVAVVTRGTAEDERHSMGAKGVSQSVVRPRGDTGNFCRALEGEL